jgi:hypothetical protein
MATFKESLDKKVIQSISNNFGVENYDQYRFGEYRANDSYSRSTELRQSLKRFVKNTIAYHPEYKIYLSKVDKLINHYSQAFEMIWNSVNEIDKELLLSLLVYRALGYEKVKLPRNNKAYWESIETAKTMVDYNDVYDPNFMHFILHKFDLNPSGYDIKLYFS